MLLVRLRGEGRLMIKQVIAVMAMFCLVGTANAGPISKKVDELTGAAVARQSRAAQHITPPAPPPAPPPVALPPSLRQVEATSQGLRTAAIRSPQPSFPPPPRPIVRSGDDSGYGRTGGPRGGGANGGQPPVEPPARYGPIGEGPQNQVTPVFNRSARGNVDRFNNVARGTP